VITSRTCSWCHTRNPSTVRACEVCHHDAHSPRMMCQCVQCLRPRRTVPSADSVLRESVARVTARRPETWGFVLARLRDVFGHTPAEQASAMGCSVDALIFLSLCRLPRAGRHHDRDLLATVDLVAVPVFVLMDVLAANAPNCVTGTTAKGEG
jgi:hypothetical protein